MADEESLIINLNSQGPYMVNNANLAQVQYLLPFATLPRKYSKFSVQVNFRSNVYVGLLTDVGFININLGRMNVFEGGMVSNNLAMIYCINSNTTAAAGPLSSFYACTISDNCDFQMDYPQSGLITVSLKTFAGADMPHMQNYNLQMRFTGLKGSEIGVANVMSVEKPITF